MIQQYRFKMRIAVVLLVMAAVGIFARQAEENPAVLLERAVQLETIEGDLDAAIALYKRIVEKFGDRRSVAAKAQFHIGLCYEKLGLTEAQKAYQKVLDNFPEQQETVKLAREKLSLLPTARAALERMQGKSRSRRSGTLQLTAYSAPHLLTESTWPILASRTF